MTKSLKPVLILLIISLLAAVTVLSLVPPVSRDALTHHLAVPKLYLQGGIYELPHLSFSYYPMNLDLLYMGALWCGSDIIPKFIHFTFALMTAALIFLYLQKHLNKLYGLLGALFFLSIPIIIKLSITVYVDLGLIFFAWAALYQIFQWLENNYRFRYIIWSGIFCGLALGTKYNGLIVLMLLNLFIIFLYARGRPGLSTALRALGHGSLFTLTALLVFSPWMIKNYVWTGNPLYPLYQNVFNSEQSIKQPQTKKQSHNQFITRKVIFQESWWMTLLIPIRIFFQGQDNQPQYFDGKLNPMLLILPFFILLLPLPQKITTELKILFWFSFLFILFAFQSSAIRIRYISPIIPPLVILSVFGLRAVLNHNIIGLSMIVLLLGFNLHYLLQQFNLVQPVPYLQGAISRDDYIQHYRPEYASLQFANQNLPEDCIILGVYLGNRGYYSNRKILFDFHLLKHAARQSNPTAMGQVLQSQGITHLLIRYDLFNQWRQHNFKKDRQKMIATFFQNRLDLLFSKQGYRLYQIKK